MQLIKMGKILLFVLLISVILRIPRFDYPFSDIFIWGDGTRDYLVANHILTYHEFPKVGPYNLFYESGILNSPLYFYLLAVFLIPFNNVLSLSLIGIILQILTLALIYLIGKKIFSKNVAILGVALYSLNPKIIEHADFLWQPTLMQPVILLGLYFLLMSKINLKFLPISLIILSLAVTIHNSALSWLPIFIILTFIILKKTKKSLSYSFKTFTLIPLSLVFFYSPLIFFYLTNTDSKISINNILSVETLYNYLPNLYSNLEQVFQIFNLGWGIGLTLTVLLILTSRLKHNFLLTFSLFILPIILSSFLSKIRLHYLILSIPFFTLLSANLIEYFNRIRWLKIILIAFMFLVFYGNLSSIGFKKPLQNYNLITNVTNKIFKDLRDIKLKNNFKNYDFFQVYSLTYDNSIFAYPVLDTILLVPLEEKINTKLVSLSDTNPYNHFQNNRRDYLVIPCIKIKLELCQNEFKKKNSEYTLEKVIYKGNYFSVFLAKLISI